ncbi:MAG: TlpA family protein disulfide reductase [Actinomycetes bacterium]
MATDLTADTPPTVDEPAVRPRRRRQLVIAAGALAVIGVGAAAGIGASRSTEAEDRVAVEGAAPSFDLERVGAEGDRVRLADFAGRPVVVNFWASWCVPCRKEMPALQAAAERLEGRVAFVGINHQDGRSPAAEFEQEVGVTYPSGYDPDGGVARDFGVVGLPTTVLIDARGRIVARTLGELTENELDELVADAFGIEAGRAGP